MTRKATTIKWEMGDFPWDETPDRPPDIENTSNQDWADQVNAQIAQPFINGQQKIEALQQQIANLTQAIAIGQNNAVERRNILVLLWILFFGVAYIQVIRPMLNVVGSVATAAKTSAGQFNPDFCQQILLPVQASITSKYGMRKNPISGVEKLHAGIDFGSAQGTPIAAPLAGKVKTIGDDPKGYGLYIVLDHGNGLETLYGHLSEVYVTQDSFIAQATAIGSVGSTGSSTGAHLHWETIMNGQPTNPENWIQKEWGTRCKK